MILVDRKINKLKQFAIDRNHFINFRYDRNEFYITVYKTHYTSTIFCRGFYGSFNSKEGRTLDEIIRQVKIFIENDPAVVTDGGNEFIGDLPMAV